MQKLTASQLAQPATGHILYGLVAIISLAPLYFGSDRPIPIAIITIFSGFLCVYWGIFATKDVRFISVPLQKLKWLALVTFLVLLWATIQALPLEIALFSNPFWMRAKQLLPDEHIKSSISINPHQSWLELSKILTYAAIFWLTLQMSRSGKSATKILRYISWSGAFYAIYGIIIQSAGIRKILWHDKVDYLDSLTSTFVNRNNFATYAGVTLVISVALFLNGLFNNTNQLKRSEFYRTIIQRLFSTSLPPLLIVFVIASALVISSSRAGVICSALGVLAFIILSNFNNEIKSHRKIFAVSSLAITAIFVIILIVGGNFTAVRMGNIGVDASLRGVIYNIALRAINDFPISGSGLGSFANIFKSYSDSSVAVFEWKTTDHVHNSYLELALELGVPASAALILVMAVIWLQSVRGASVRRRDGYIPAAAASGIIVVASHAMFDFSAQIPAIAIVFVVLLAVGMAQSWSSQIDLSDYKDTSIISIFYCRTSIVATLLLGIILTLAAVWQFNIYFTGYADAKKLKNMAYDQIEKAMSAGAETTHGKSLLTLAEGNLKQSIKLSPADPYSWTYLTYAKLLSGDNPQEVASFLAASIANGCCWKDLVLFRIEMIPQIWDNASYAQKQIFKEQINLARKIEPAEAEKVIGSFQEINAYP